MQCPPISQSTFGRPSPVAALHREDTDPEATYPLDLPPPVASCHDLPRAVSVLGASKRRVFCGPPPEDGEYSRLLHGAERKLVQAQPEAIAF